jgi:ribonuclease P protein component
VAKRAVDRNRLKRLAREAFRRRVSLAANDYVVLARQAAKDAGNATLRESLEQLFNRAGGCESRDG